MLTWAGHRGHERKSPRYGTFGSRCAGRATRLAEAGTDATGTITTPPGSHADVVAGVIVIVTGTLAAVAALLTSAGLLARLILDRRRLARWDAERGSVGPLWTGRRAE